MPNSDIPNGFKPAGNPHNGGGSPASREYVLLSSNAEIGVGTPVSVVAGGLERAVAGTDQALAGISAEYKAASDGGTCRVWDHPEQEFVAQTDNGTGTATASGVEGLNINFIGTGVTNQRSTAELDETSAAATVGHQFRVKRLSKEFGRNAVNAFGEFNRLIIVINDHQSVSDTGVTGV